MIEIWKDIEIWEDIEGYEGIYQISNQGRVRSLKYGKVKVLRPRKNNDGYLQVNLYKNGEVKNYRINRLVATAFLPNPQNLPEVNHIDEDKENNCVGNLEWCDRRYNINYGTRTERTKKPVSQFNLNGDLIKRWDSVSEASRELDFNLASISRAARNEYNRCGSNFYKGYYWSF